MLLSLPEELQTLVLEHLASPGCKWSDSDDWPQRDIVPEDVRSLSNVCLVSKSLYRLAWPILYRAFTNCEPLEGPSSTDRLEPSLFLRTICLKPEYGLALRSLSIDLCTPIGAMHASELFDLLQGDATLAALFQWKIRSFWYGDDDDNDEDDDSVSMGSNGAPAKNDVLTSLLRALNMQLPEAQMAVLLLLCPRIKDLCIRPGLLRGSSVAAKLLKVILEAAISKDYQVNDLPQPEFDFEQEESDYIMAQMFGSPWPEQRMQKLPTLQHLQQLSLYSSIMPGSGTASFRYLLLALPSLRTLEVLGLAGDDENPLPDLSLDVRCAQLKKLNLLECELLASDVLEIVKCCPDLTELALDWSTGWESFTGLRLGEIVDALAIHTPNLDVLKLSSAQLICQPQMAQHPYTMGPSLSQLSKLGWLQLDHYAIYGPQDSDSRTPSHYLSELLPKSLQYLEIGPNTFTGGPGQEIKPVDAWEQWQIDDLNNFLQDESFRRLGRFDMVLDESSTRRHIHQDTMTRHGWQIFEDNPENWVFRIENPRRS
jgi:hypothetical protein